MTFLLSKFLRFFLTPSNLVLFLMALGVVQLWRSGGRRGLRLVTAMTLVLTSVAVFPIGEWLIAPLEARFPMPAIPKQVDGIILLGGAVEPRLAEGRVEPAVNGAAERLLTFMTLARRYPDAKLLLVGGEASIISRGRSEAELTRDLLVEEGFDPHRMVLEPRSRNTIENAEFAKALVNPKATDNWLLVTSAVHMPRAVGCFRHVGWATVPLPTDFRRGEEGSSIALVQHLGFVELAVKEWAGLLTYRLLGHIDAIFPAP